MAQAFDLSPSGPTLTGGTGGLYNLSLTYAPDGDVLTGNDSVNGNWTYGYDPFNRLLNSNKNSGAEIYSYDYDRFGNRWHQNGPYSMQLSFSGGNNRMDGYSYDLAGNLLSDVTHSYTYDAENRIIQVDGGATASYVYDADGQRIRKTTVSGTVDFLYDLAGHQIGEVNSSGVWTRAEIYAGGRHLATYAGGASGVTYFNHADWLGTERLRTDKTGVSCETITSLPFGDAQATSGSCGDPSPMHFTGKERDSESGLDNFGARYMASSFGRFTSPDSTAYSKPMNPQGWNLYAYTLDNPLLYIDPRGHEVSLANCTDKNQCAKALAKAAKLPEEVKATVDKNGNLKLEGDLSKIRGGNALRLKQLVESDKKVNFWIGDRAPGKELLQTQEVAGGLSGTTSQGYNQNFAVVQADPSKVNSRDLRGVFLNPDGSTTAGDIPGANVEEAAAHELLGHVWADLLGGQSAGTNANKKEALIAEDRVRNTDPARGLKIRHQGQRESIQLIHTTDLPRISSPGNEP